MNIKDKIKNWFIIKLGGYTEENMQEYKKECIDFCDKYLTNDQKFENVFVKSYDNYTDEYTSNNFIFLGEFSRISNSVGGKLICAPWSKNNIVEGYNLHSSKYNE